MRNASATGMPSASRTRTTFSPETFSSASAHDLLGHSARDDGDAVVVADHEIAGVHGHAGAFDRHADAVDVDAPEGVVCQRARDERRVAHLDQRGGVAGVAVADDAAGAAEARRRGEELAPVGARGGRDDHDVAGLLRIDGQDLAAIPVVARRSDIHLDHVHGQRVAGEPGARVERAHVRREQVVAHPDAVEAVGDDGHVQLLEPLEQGHLGRAALRSVPLIPPPLIVQVTLAKGASTGNPG